MIGLMFVLLHLSGQGQIVSMYEDICNRAEDHWKYEGDFGFAKFAGECFVYKRNVGEVYWQAADGRGAIIFPLRDETDGKPPKCYTRPALDGCNTETVCGDQVSTTLVYCGPMTTLPIPPPAEPIEVPAVQYEIPAPYPCNLPTSNGSDCLTGPETYYKCADKSRILLTSEDGRHWCHKVQN